MARLHCLVVTLLLRLGSGASRFTDLGAPPNADGNPRLPQGFGVGRTDTAHSSWTLRGPFPVPYLRGSLPTPEKSAPSGWTPGTVSTHPLVEWVLPNAHAITMLSSLMTLLMMGFVMALVCMMMQANDSDDNRAPSGQGTLRDPPSWSPEMESRSRNPYTFENYTRDLMMWSLATNLRPHQQAAAVVLRLGGTARDVVRELTPIELTQGGIVNGVQLDPLAYLMHGLQTRYAPLSEETALRAVSELTAFTRRGSETTDALLSRFHTTVHLARSRGQLTIPPLALSWILIRAVGVSHMQMTHLLAPLRGRLPESEEQLNELVHYIRRMGHILEHRPGNIASAASGRSSTPYTRTYFSGGPAGSAPTFAALAGEEPYATEDGPSWTDHNSGHSVEAYPAVDFDSGTDSDTSSDDGAVDIDYSDIAGMTPEQADEHIYWQYAQAKKRWRRHSEKPVRRVRRFVRRKGGKGWQACPHIHCPA